MSEKRAAIYARISVKDANVPKVADQIVNLHDLARQRGLTVAPGHVFADDGISASKGKRRPGFEELLSAVESGAVDVVLATEEERFARTVTDKQRLQLACMNAGATWLTIRDGEVDPATASGEFMSTLRAAFGKLESSRKSERQKQAHANRRAKGLAPNLGPRPFGWNDDRMTLNEPEAELIRKGIKDALAGKNLTAITAEWRNSPFQPSRADAWGRVTIMKTLTRWRNAGVVVYKDEPLMEDGKEKIGEWEPITSVEDIKALRTSLATRGQKRVASRMLTGIARCHCGEYMIVTGARSVSGYKCSAAIRGVPTTVENHCGMDADTLDGLVIGELVDLYLRRPEGPIAGEEADTAALRQLHEKRANALAAIENIKDAIDALVYSATEAKPRMDKQRRILDEVELQIARLTSASAHVALVNELMGSLWAAFDAIDAEPKALRSKNVRVPSDRESKAGASRYALRSPEVREALVAKFAELELDQQRTLVRSLLSVKVVPFVRGMSPSDRVVIKAL